MERQRSHSDRLSEVLSPESKLFPNANALCRRAHDYILSMSKMRASMERKLAVLNRFIFVTSPRLFVYVIVLYISITVCLCADARLSDSGAHQEELPLPFTFVVFICVWKRYLLTGFVLDHFASIGRQLKPTGISIELFIVGSDVESTKELADRVEAAYVIHANHPVGRKHQQGLLSLRDYYEHQVSSRKSKNLPEAIAIFGSDDVVNANYFIEARRAMAPSDGAPAVHAFGLQDVWFYHLHSHRLVYTPGYREFETPLAGTVGCGRAYSWPLLEQIDWHMWDEDINHGLDQSAVRNIMQRATLVSEVSMALLGRPVNVLAIDVKSDGFAKGGTNLWAFDNIVAAGDGKGRLKRFSEEHVNISLVQVFGTDFVHGLEKLHADMLRAESE